MANSVFLDTSGWLALLHVKDVNHALAKAVWRELGKRDCQVVLTDWIIAETGNSLARTPIRDRFPEAVDQVWESHNVEVVFVDNHLLVQATNDYRRYANKTWGLVDCHARLRDYGSIYQRPPLRAGWVQAPAVNWPNNPTADAQQFIR